MATLTSSGLPVIMNIGSSPRTGVLMYVFVLARKAFILHPKQREGDKTIVRKITSVWMTKNRRHFPANIIYRSNSTTRTHTHAHTLADLCTSVDRCKPLLSSTMATFVPSTEGRHRSDNAKDGLSKLRSQTIFQRNSVKFNYHDFSPS